jgi:hypothetical protein
MNLQKVKSKQNLNIFVGILKVTEEKSRIRNPGYIYQSYGSESVPNVTDLEHWY